MRLLSRKVLPSTSKKGDHEERNILGVHRSVLVQVAGASVAVRHEVVHESLQVAAVDEEVAVEIGWKYAGAAGVLAFVGPAVAVAVETVARGDVGGVRRAAMIAVPVYPGETEQINGLARFSRTPRPGLLSFRPPETPLIHGDGHDDDVPHDHLLHEVRPTQCRTAIS